MAHFKALMAGKAKVMGESSGFPAGSTRVCAEDFPPLSQGVASFSNSQKNLASCPSDVLRN